MTERSHHQGSPERIRKVKPAAVVTKKSGKNINKVEKK